MSIFKACDIRGVYGTELRLEHASALGRAIAVHKRPDRVIVAGDGRLSTPALKHALTSALVECGVDVIDLGSVPTPVFYFARRQLGVDVGVMVTASHNPAPDNGFKIVLGDLPITQGDLDELRVLIESGVRCGKTRVGRIRALDIVDEYLAFTRALFPGPAGRLKIVVDAGNGMLGPVGPRVFRDLRYDVVELFTDIDGRFPNHPPNPALAANLEALCRQVREQNADLGVAFDGDGDRVAFVDERGQPVDNDRIIVLFAREAITKHPGATIVFDQKCSDVVAEEITRDGGVPRMEKSGHTFIKSTFLESRAAYGGELAGHHFFAELGGDDGLVASLKLAAIVQASSKSLSQLVAPIPRYSITPDLRLAVSPDEADAIIAAIRNNVRGAVEKSQMDGVRLRFPDGWGMVRASVTEPAITLRFEGRTREALERIQREFVKAAPQLAGRI